MKPITPERIFLVGQRFHLRLPPAQQSPPHQRQEKARHHLQRRRRISRRRSPGRRPQRLDRLRSRNTPMSGLTTVFLGCASAVVKARIFAADATPVTKVPSLPVLCIPATSTKIKKINSSNSPRSRTLVKNIASCHLRLRCRDHLVRRKRHNAASSPNTQAATVSRTTKAVHYRLQGGSTKVDFQGTDLLPARFRRSPRRRQEDQL